MPLYDVLQPIKHDGQRQQNGSIEMPAKAAAPLIASGVLQPGNAKPAASLDVQAVADAIMKLDTQDSSLWLKNGKPDAKALTAILGAPVSARLRDEAFAEYSKQ